MEDDESSFYFFDTDHDAIDALRTLRRAGVDVGRVSVLGAHPPSAERPVGFSITGRTNIARARTALSGTDPGPGDRIPGSVRERTDPPRRSGYT